MGRSVFENLYVGVIFGVAMAACFLLSEGIRSVGRAAAFIAASAAAYPVAVSATFALFTSMPHAPSSHTGAVVIPLPGLFGGGFTGALIIFAAGLFLFGRAHNGARSLIALPGWAVAGGVLAMVGWASGSFLGRALLLAVETLHLRPASETFQNAVVQDVPAYFSLYVVWQTGVALCLGLMLAGQVAIADTAESIASPEVSVSIPRPRKRLSVAAVLFFGSVLVFLGWQVTRFVQTDRAVARRMGAYRKAVSEAPSVADLPPMAPLGFDETLVLEDIGGLFVQKPMAQDARVQLGDPKRGFAGIPPSTTYSVWYVPKKDESMGLVQPMVRAFVVQYPNADWARYKTKYPEPFNPSLDDPKVLTTVTKFSQRVVMNTQMRSSNGDGALYFLWPSGNLVVLISYEMREVNEEFIKRYLEKHPSGL